MHQAPFHTGIRSCPLSPQSHASRCHLECIRGPDPFVLVPVLTLPCSFCYRARPNLFRQEHEENFSCPHFCMGNLETKGGLCPTGSLPGASASSSNGVSTFLCFTFLSSIFASSILSSFTHFSYCPAVLFPLAPGACIPCHFCPRFPPFSLCHGFDAQASWRSALSPAVVQVPFLVRVGLPHLLARHCSIKGHLRSTVVAENF